MTTRQLLLLGIWVYSILLVGTIYFTRATRRRVMGAVAGGAAVAVVGVESLSHALGFWRYPSTDAPYGPLLIYPLVVLVFAVIALLGWRVTRRFGWRGQLPFLAALMIVGPLRDYGVAERALKVIVFAPGITTVLVDAACWGGTAALAQIVMRSVAGPAAGDRLTQRRGKPAPA